MIREIKSNEKHRRKFNKSFDESPSIHHRYNYRISKKYISSKRILDIGCWSGQFIQLALKSTSNVYGIDPGASAIKYAARKYRSAKFFVGVAHKLPFKKNYFDAVTFLEVIEHIPRALESRSLKEINRVLKPNGILILSTPSNHPLSIILDPAYFIIGHRHYSVEQINKLLSQSGFVIEKVYLTGGIFRLLSLIIDSILKHLLKSKRDYPTWIKRKIEDEYKSGGFATLHIIARKI